MPRRYRHRPALAALALLSACALASAGEPMHYAIDPVHTRVMFEIDHAGFSKAIGTLSGSTGSLQFDEGDWSTAKLDVTLPMQRLDMGDSGWSASLFAPRFLDVQRYPQARFVSTRVERLQDNRGTVCGDFTLRGVTRPLCMQFKLNRIARYPLPPFRHTAGFSATATLKRSDFGITAWQSLIGDAIELRIEAELTRSKGDDRRETPAAGTATR
ncbi:YceI family protein [Thermomonas fusca]|uniref:YceI family protein n=1 Tax=Thermomonas fusca TaxID=215690 RepID=UPI00057169BA|nr:YceI family protein [Thermomonas fusca]